MKKLLTGIISLAVVLTLLGSAFLSDTKTTLASADPTVVVSGKDVTVTWSKADGIDGYFVMRSTSEEDGYVAIDMLDINQTTITDKNVAGGTYYYKIQAFSNGEVYDITSPVEAVVEKQEINIPSSKTIAIAVGNSAKIAWPIFAEGQGYFVMRSTSEEDGYVAVDMLDVNQNMSTDKNLTAGTYYYKVQTFVDGQIYDITTPAAVVIK